MSDPRPQVIVTHEDGSTNVLPDVPATQEYSALAYHRAWWRGASYYHRDGQRYRVLYAVPERPLGTLSRLRALTIYNPRVQVRHEYSAAAYELSDLKTALASAIRADDDVLTQFYEGEDLLAQLDAASTFDDVVEVLKRAELGPNEDEDDETE